MLAQSQRLIHAAHAGAVQSDIDLHQDIDPRPGFDGGLGELLRVVGALHRDDDLRQAGNSSELGNLGGPDHLVGDQDARMARIHHRRRFPDGRSRQSDRAGGDLHFAESGVLVDLHMGPQRRRYGCHPIGHFGYVLPGLGKVEKEGGGGNLVAPLPDLSLCRFQPMVGQGDPPPVGSRRGASSKERRRDINPCSSFITLTPSMSQ